MGAKKMTLSCCVSGVGSLDVRPVGKGRAVRTEPQAHPHCRTPGIEETVHEMEQKSEVQGDTDRPGAKDRSQWERTLPFTRISSTNSIHNMICVRCSNSISNRFCKIPSLRQKSTISYQLKLLLDGKKKINVYM